MMQAMMEIDLGKKERKLPMFQRCQLSNLAIEPGQIQDSLLLPLKQCGQLKREQFLHLLKGLPTRWKGKKGQESSQKGTHVEPEPILGHQDTNISHDHTQTTLNYHSTLEPTHTLHAPHIQAKDLRHLKITKNP